MQRRRTGSAVLQSGGVQSVAPLGAVESKPRRLRIKRGDVVRRTTHHITRLRRTTTDQQAEYAIKSRNCVNRPDRPPRRCVPRGFSSISWSTAAVPSAAQFAWPKRRTSARCPTFHDGAGFGLPLLPRPVLERLRIVRRPDALLPGQVGDRLCQLEDAMVRPRAQAHLPHTGTCVPAQVSPCPRAAAPSRPPGSAP